MDNNLVLDGGPGAGYRRLMSHNQSPLPTELFTPTQLHESASKVTLEILNICR